MDWLVQDNCILGQVQVHMMAEEQAMAGKWMTKEVMTTEVEQLSTIESNSL